MVAPNLVGSVGLLLAGMGLLFLYLRRYEGHFDQPRLFFALLVGLFAGALLRFMEQKLFGFEVPRLLQPEGDLATATLVYSAAYSTVGYAMLEGAAKTAILGLKKFRTRADAPFHGAAMGIGFGAMWASAVATTFFISDGKDMVLTGPAVLFDLFVLALAFAMLLANAASGVWVGRGAAQGSLWRGLMLGTLWQIPALACYWAFLNIAGAVVLSSLLALAYGILAVYVADKRILQPAIPPEVRDQLRRQERRERRKAT
ncbi:MAG: hypothetical protein QOD77_953 [Thermoplasmata archaeon]|jgi:hypothetical protein|nr:hypothetical protein [Thermoplasmata archaeon]